MERTYTSLPPHSYISYILRAVNINHWSSSSDSITFYIDGQLVHTLYPSTDITTTTQGHCGHPNKDFIWYDIVGVRPHSSSSLSLKYVISNTGYASASYGLHNLNILFRTGIPYKTNLACYGEVLSFTPPCNADGLHYKTTAGALADCDASCDTCFGPGGSGCFGCQVKYFFDGISCLPCASNCESCTGTSTNQCVRCSTGFYLQQGSNTCTTTCTTPYIGTGFYLQQDSNTCTTTCTTPYIGTGAYKVCSPPCQPSEYTFYDSIAQKFICQQKCTPSYTIQSSADCIVCQLSEYRAYDTSGQVYCASSCLSPYQVKNSAYCLLCNLGEYISYTFQGQLLCMRNCIYPYKLINPLYCAICEPNQFISYNTFGNVVCLEDCSSPYQYLNSTHCTLQTTTTLISTMEATGLSSIIISRILLLISPGSSGLLLWGCLADMLKYIRYMDIDYSPKLLQLFKIRSLMQIITGKNSSKRDIVERRFREYALPRTFEEYRQMSSFLANSWKWLTSLIVILMIVIINKSFRKVEKPKWIRTIYLQVESVFEWSYCISTFVTYLGSIAFYSSLEYLVASHYKSGLEIASLSLSIFANTMTVVFFGKVISIIRRIRRSRRLVAVYTETTSAVANNPYKGFEVVFEAFKTDSAFKQAYFTVFIIRVYLFNIAIVCLFAYPIIQGITICALSLFMCLYLLLVRSMKSKLDLVRSILQELLLSVVNVFVTILAFMDQRGDIDPNSKERGTIEDVIIWCNVIFFGVALMHVTITIVQLIRAAYLKYKASKQAKASIQVQKSHELKPAVKNTSDISIPNLEHNPNPRQLESSIVDRSQVHLNLLNSSNTHEQGTLMISNMAPGNNLSDFGDISPTLKFNNGVQNTRIPTMILPQTLELVPKEKRENRDITYKSRVRQNQVVEGGAYNSIRRNNIIRFKEESSCAGGTQYVSAIIDEIMQNKDEGFINHYTYINAQIAKRITQRAVQQNK